MNIDPQDQWWLQSNIKLKNIKSLMRKKNQTHTWLTQLSNTPSNIWDTPKMTEIFILSEFVKVILLRLLCQIWRYKHYLVYWVSHLTFWLRTWSMINGPQKDIILCTHLAAFEYWAVSYSYNVEPKFYQFFKKYIFTSIKDKHMYLNKYYRYMKLTLHLTKYCVQVIKKMWFDKERDIFNLG